VGGPCECLSGAMNGVLVSRVTPIRHFILPEGGIHEIDVSPVEATKSLRNACVVTAEAVETQRFALLLRHNLFPWVPRHESAHRALTHGPFARSRMRAGINPVSDVLLSVQRWLPTAGHPPWRGREA